MSDSTVAEISQNESESANRLPQIQDVLLFLCVLCVPFSVRFELERPHKHVAAISLPLVDLMIWITAGTILAFGWREFYAAFTRIKNMGSTDKLVVMPRVEVWIFVAVISFGTLANRGPGGIAEVIQVLDYFIIWYWLVSRSTTKPVTLFASIALVVILTITACYQIWTSTPSCLVTSLFRDKANFMAALVILAPIMWCACTLTKQTAVGWIGYVVLAVGCSCLGSLFAMILILLELLLAAFLLGKRSTVGYAAFVVAVIALLAVAPRSYRSDVLADAGAVIRVPLAQQRQRVLLAKSGANHPIPRIHIPLSDWHLFVGFKGPGKPRMNEPAKPQDDNANSATDHNQTEHDNSNYVVRQYFTDGWAANKLLIQRPIFGSGLGSFNDVIGTAYGNMERTGTSFPNSINGYLFLGICAGFAGLVTWFNIVRMSLVQGFHQLRIKKSNPEIFVGAIVGIIGATTLLVGVSFVDQPVIALLVMLFAYVCSGENDETNVSAPA